MKNTFKYGSWFVEYSPEDGARLDRLCYNDYDLLTTEPNSFKAPSSNLGEYEKRPVYGYDDCFPTCEVSSFPGTNWEIPDHGEVCWLNWNSCESADKLVFSAKSKVIPVQLNREMVFTDSSITWNFKVLNDGTKTLPFLHIMHPLMRLGQIAGLSLPEFHSVYDHISKQDLNLKNVNEVQEFLLNKPSGSASMLFLRQIKKGEMSWTYKNGLSLKVVFPKKLFPAIGIWWNNNGYPDEPGLRRNECAFEPIPGFTSKLSESYSEKKCLEVPPKDCFKWQIKWEVFK